MKIHHFFHIYADGFNVSLLVNQHLIALQEYGLSRSLSEIYIGLVGKPDNRANIKELLKNSKVRIEISAEQDTGFEQVTLNAMFEHSQKNQGYYLYTHTKSASNPSIFNQCWARSMEYFCVVQWQYAIARLEEVDAVGCHWLTKKQFPHIADHNNPHGYPYFGGNFWWSKSDILRVIGRPNSTRRWDAETWIGRKIDIKIFDLCPGWPDAKNFHITF